MRIKLVPAVDFQAARSITIWQLVIFEMLWHLPIKIPIKHCKIWKWFSSTGKEYAVIFWYGESRSFCQDVSGPDCPIWAWLGSFVSLSLVLFHTGPSFICCLSYFNFSLPVFQKCVHLVGSSYITKWMVSTFHLCSLPFSAKFSPPVLTGTLGKEEK